MERIGRMGFNLKLDGLGLPFIGLTQETLSTCLDLMKLEKLEIGGIKGRALNLQIQSLYQEFLDSYKIFTEKPYDCLDITNTVRIIMCAGTAHMHGGE